MKKVYNKLIRDNIPTIMEREGKKFQIKTLDEENYLLELKKKLCEEANEVFTANSRKEIIEEMSDVLEIIDALKNIYHVSNDEINDVQQKKAIKNGKFEHRLYLEYVIEEDL